MEIMRVEQFIKLSRAFAGSDSAATSTALELIDRLPPEAVKSVWPDQLNQSEDMARRLLAACEDFELAEEIEAVLEKIEKIRGKA